MVTMDLQEMRAEKKELEKSLSGVIKEFEEKTGLRVQGIEIVHHNLAVGFPLKLVKSYLSELRTNVEI